MADKMSGAEERLISRRDFLKGLGASAVLLLGKEAEKKVRLTFLPVDFGEGSVTPVVSEEYLAQRKKVGWPEQIAPEEYWSDIRVASVDPYVFDREDPSSSSWKDSAYAYYLTDKGLLVRDKSKDVIRQSYTEDQGWSPDSPENLGKKPVAFVLLPSEATRITWPLSGFYPLEQLAAGVKDREKHLYAVLSFTALGAGTPDQPKRSVMFLQRVAYDRPPRSQA